MLMSQANEDQVYPIGNGFGLREKGNNHASYIPPTQNWDGTTTAIGRKREDVSTWEKESVPEKKNGQFSTGDIFLAL